MTVVQLVQSMIVPVLSLIIAAQALLMRRMGDRLLIHEYRITTLEKRAGMKYVGEATLRAD